MAQPRAVVHVVGAEAARQFLEQVVFLVGAAGRGQKAQGVRPVLLAQGQEAGGHQIKRLVPAGRNKHAVAADERRREPLRMRGEIQGEAALDAQAALVVPVRSAQDMADAPVLHVHVQLTTHAAIRAGGAHGARFAQARLLTGVGHAERTCRADLQTLAAKNAVRLGQSGVASGHDLGGGATVAVIDGLVDLHFVAGLHAAAAEDAFGKIADNERVAGFGPVARFRPLKSPRAHAVAEGQALQGAIARRRAEQAVVISGVEHEAQDRLAGADHAFGLGVHDHALGRRGRAGRDQGARAPDLDHADAAGAGGRAALQMAQGRDEDAVGRGRFQNGLAGSEDAGVSLMVSSMASPSVDAVKRTGLEAGQAAHAFFAVDAGGLLPGPGHGPGRAGLVTQPAFAAARLVHLEFEQGHATFGRAALFNDVGLEFVPEMAQGRQDRVGRGLAEAAQDASVITAARSSRVRRSPGSPFPSQMRVRISS
jgi:hypothetical protein